MHSGIISRRRFVRSATTLAAGVAFGGRKLHAQDAQQPAMVVQGRAAAAKAKITTTKLRSNLYALQGSGGNIAVLTGPQGKVMVDAGISTSHPQIMEAMNAVSADPLTHLINTHWHWDHTDGNEAMHAAGATIIAQENTKKRLSSAQTIALFNVTFPAAPTGAVPAKTFAETDKAKLNGVTLQMTHYAPAHTDSDISVLFVEADVLHVGDTWFNGFYPLIDYSSGGNINGMIKAADWSLANSGPETIIIPGHGPIGDKKQLQEFRDVLAGSRDKVAALKAQGKSVTEVVAAKPTAEYDAKFGGGSIKPDVFVGLVYQGV